MLLQPPARPCTHAPQMQTLEETARSRFNGSVVSIMAAKLQIPPRNFFYIVKVRGTACGTPCQPEHAQAVRRRKGARAW